MTMKNIEEPMFWNDKNIFWYIVASEYTKYHENMSNELKNIIDVGESMLDMGCGIGIYAVNFSSYLSKILAVDKDLKALNFLKNKIKSKNIKNIKTICMDCEDKFNIDLLCKSDNILFSHYGKIDKCVYNFKDIVNKRLIIIRNYDENINSSNIKGRSTVEDVIYFLKNNGIKHSIYKQSYEFGQPFIDTQDAVNFFEYWYGKNGIKLISNLVDIDYEYNGTHFSKFYNKTKNTAIIVVNKEDL